MSSFGFHGEQPNDAFSAPRQKKRVAKKSNSTSSVLKAPSVTPVPQSMTYNGMYSQPAPMPRVVTRNTAPSYSNMTPVNQRNSPVVSLPQPPVQQGQDDQVFAQKVALWNEKRRVRRQESQEPETVPSSQSQSYRPHIEEVVAHQSIEIPSFGATKPQEPSVFEQYSQQINRSVDSVRTEIQTLKRTLEVNGQLDPEGVLNTVQKHIQQITVDHESFKEHIKALEVAMRSLQGQLDEKKQSHQDTASVEELDSLEESVNERLHKFEADVKEALKAVSDGAHWIYGVTLQEKVQLYDTPDMQRGRVKAELAKGTKVLLTYPMTRRDNGVWMRARTISADGTFSVDYAPIWTFPPHVLQQYQKTPPPPEQRVVYIGNFSTD